MLRFAWAMAMWGLVGACSGDTPSTEPADPTEEPEVDTETVDELPACAATLPRPVTRLATCAASRAPGALALRERARLPLALPWGAFFGRLDDTTGDGVVHLDDALRLVRSGGTATFDLEGTPLGDPIDDAYRIQTALADVDRQRPGAEMVASWYQYRAEFDLLSVFGDGALWNTRLRSDTNGTPFVTDLQGDGTPEIVLGHQLVDAVTGERQGALEGLPFDQWGGVSLAADLDRDGVGEIAYLTLWPWSDESRVGLWNADGTHRADCWSALRVEEDETFLTFAVADMDGDPEGEVVFVGDRVVGVCDADGTLLRSTSDLGLSQSGTVAVVQLDTDATPELVLSDFGQLVALDDDLSELWRYAPVDNGWYVFTAADLDADGQHEVFVHHNTSLELLSSTGAVLDSLTVPGHGSWLAAPRLVDVDGDDRAELLVWGLEETIVVDDGEAGWAATWSNRSWPGHDHHPLDRRADESVSPSWQAHWAHSETNVWNASVAGTAWSGPADLSVTLDPPCSDEAGLAATAWVHNSGYEDHLGVVELALDDGQSSRSVSVEGPIPTGWAVPVSLPLSNAEELSVSIMVDDCDDTDHVATWP